VKVIVPDRETAAALLVGDNPLKSELWSIETRLDSDCIALLSTASVLLQVTSSGVDHLHGLIPDSVTIARAPELRARATAEVALTLALGVLLRTERWEEVRRARQWEWLPPAPRLHGRRVFILGRGSIGSACAALFSGVGAEVHQFGRREPSLDDAFAAVETCDLLVVALPLTPQTLGVVNRSVLGRLPESAVVINVARGSIVDSEALLDEVSSGRLRAGLDVFDEEPLPATHPFWSVDGMMLSPHVGGNVAVPAATVATVLKRQHQLLSVGLSAENVVDPRLYRW